MVLGQSGGVAGAGSIGEAVIWIIVLVVCCVVFGVALMRLRKHFLGDDGEAGQGAVLPLGELRRMRDAGELSEDEFRRAVEVLASQARSQGSGGGSGSGPPV